MAHTARLKQDYDQLTSLYDAADALISTLPALPEAEQAEYFRIAAPLTAELEAAADTLTSGFIACAEGKGKAQRKTVEGTLRKVFSAFDRFRQQAKHASATVGGQLLAHAERVQDALGQAVLAFVQFVELSLDRIMQKADLEALRKREPRIARLLQQLAAAAPARS